MAGPGGGPPRRRYDTLPKSITFVRTITDFSVVIPSLEKGVTPASVDTFAVMRTFPNGMSMNG
jgi:hypothetical protein